MKRISVLGAGTWGAALARMFASNSDNQKSVTLWSALPEEIEQIKKTHKHQRLIPDEMPENIIYTADISEAVKSADMILLVVPSIFTRDTARKIAPLLSDGQIIIDAAKGLEAGTHLTLCEVIEEEIANPNIPVVALSGPTHAEEVALGLPTVIVAASANEEAAIKVQETFSNDIFRVYRNSDRKGTEICGALKNIIALAAGISEGLGCGDNTKAAIITRGMAEMTRLGMRLGCAEQTFSGLAGIGDLVVTCTSHHSRNGRAGVLIGKGMSAADACKEVGMVVEGLNALPAAIELSKCYEIELPICDAVNNIVTGKMDAKDALTTLMTRTLKAE